MSQALKNLEEAKQIVAKARTPEAFQGLLKEAMEKRGVIGPAVGTRPREVLISPM